MSRIAKVLSALADKNQAAFVPFIMAGDPNTDISMAILNGLPAAGADIIELGMAFTDPMADGPAIQAAGLRALSVGQTVSKTLNMVRAFRDTNPITPIVLMGYYNPIYSYGVEKFLVNAKASGVDGLIIVDLPPEEDSELCLPAREQGIDFIRLATPTTGNARLPAVLRNTSGFVYYVSVTGITGKAAGKFDQVSRAIENLRSLSELPIAIGFGIKTPQAAENFAKIGDAVVVGSAIVDQIGHIIDGNRLEDPSFEVDNIINSVLTFAADISSSVHSARKE